MSADTKLIVEQLCQPSEDDQVQDDSVKVYGLSLGSITLAHLYATDKYYSIVWWGVFSEFNFANEDAANFINTQLESVRGELTLVNVSLVVSHRLQRFTLNAFAKPGDYDQLSSVTNKASFARYDFDCSFGDGSPVRYTFTIEKAEAQSKDACEMAFLLPRTQRLAKGLLYWIACKHVDHRKLMPIVRDPGKRRHIYESLLGIALGR